MYDSPTCGTASFTCGTETAEEGDYVKEKNVCRTAVSL